MAEVAAAMRVQASLLVTNDEGLMRHSPVATLSVEDALKVLPEYATGMSTVHATSAYHAASLSSRWVGSGVA